MDKNTKYFVEKKKTIYGPFAYDLIVTMWLRNGLLLTDKIKQDGKNWIEVATVAKSLEKNRSKSYQGWHFLAITFVVVGLILAITGLIDSQKDRGVESLSVGAGFVCLILGTGIFIGSRGKTLSA